MPPPLSQRPPAPSVGSFCAQRWLPTGSTGVSLHKVSLWLQEWAQLLGGALNKEGMGGGGCVRVLWLLGQITTNWVASYNRNFSSRSSQGLSLNSRCWQHLAPSEGSREGSFLDSSSFWGLLAFLGLWLHPSDLCLSLDLGPTWVTQGDLISRSLIILIKTLFPIKVIFMSSRG